MIKNLSYNSKKINTLLLELVGRPFSFIERLKLGGIGSNKLVISDASKETFKLQGGVLSETELANFELDGVHPIFLRMRHWDDMAKDLNFKYQYNIDFYRDMALNLLIKKYNHF